MKINLPQFILFSLLLALISISCKFKEENAAAQTPAVSAPAAGYPEGPGLDEGEPNESGSAPRPDPASASASTETAPVGVQTTYSGLKYEVLRAGTGRRPTRYNHVKVNYRGYFPDGKTFDENKGVILSLNRVVQGWQEGIPLMREGAKYRLTVPPNLGYGPRGKPPTIPPNATLLFDIELLEVKY